MNKFEEDFKIYVAWNHSALFLVKPVTTIALGPFVSEFGLLNSFLEDEDCEEFDGDYLFILLQPNNVDVLEVLIAQQEADNLNFIGEYDYEGGFIVLVYSIPEHMKEDFEKFKQGKYSQMSKAFQQLHSPTINRGNTEEMSFQHMVFSKNEEFREKMSEYLGIQIDKGSELWSVPSLSDREILKISKYVTTSTEPLTESIEECEGTGTGGKEEQFNDDSGATEECGIDSTGNGE